MDANDRLMQLFDQIHVLLTKMSNYQHLPQQFPPGILTELKKIQQNFLKVKEKSRAILDQQKNREKVLLPIEESSDETLETSLIHHTKEINEQVSDLSKQISQVRKTKEKGRKKSKKLSSTPREKKSRKLFKTLGGDADWLPL